MRGKQQFASGMTVGGVIMLCLALVSISLRPHMVGAQSGGSVFAVTSSNRLLQFNVADPATITAQQAMSGLQAGESILGIDFRPATGGLVALGSTSRLYNVNTQTGVASVIGTQPITLTLEGTAFGFDFNPTVDRIRLVSNAGQDLRLNPNNGVVGAVDGRLAFASGDANAGVQPAVIAAAYTNSVAGATSTTLYVIDSARDVLATQGAAGPPAVSPNSGQLFTVGALGIDVSDMVSFDIGQSGTAYAAIGTGANATDFATVDLASGRVTRVATIGGGEAIRGIAVQIAPPPATPTPTTAPVAPTVAPTTAPVAPTVAPTTIPVPTVAPLPPELPPTGGPMPVSLPDTGSSSTGASLALLAAGILTITLGVVLRRKRHTA